LKWEYMPGVTTQLHWNILLAIYSDKKRYND
jgi:hypothetical protein